MTGEVKRLQKLNSQLQNNLMESKCENGLAKVNWASVPCGEVGVAFRAMPNAMEAVLDGVS